MLVLLNRAAGTLVGAPIEEIARRVDEGLRAKGVTAEVRVLAGKEMAGAARAAAKGPHDAIVAGGGDGTLNTVASALIGTDKAFGVLPLGTHNHFAKDLGMPDGLDEAVAALATAVPRPIDVAEVNGHPFLNFTGMGLHPEIVRAREALRAPRRRNKFFVLVLAFVTALRRVPILRVGLQTPESLRWRTTPSVIVCSNPHQMRLFGLEEMSYPDRGVLNVYLARPTRWYALAWLAIRSVFRVDMARGFEALVLPALELHLHRRRVTVTIDGEIVSLTTPLKYHVRRGALKVLTPRPSS